MPSFDRQTAISADPSSLPWSLPTPTQPLLPPLLPDDGQPAAVLLVLPRPPFLRSSSSSRTQAFLQPPLVLPPQPLARELLPQRQVEGGRPLPPTRRAGRRPPLSVGPQSTRGQIREASDWEGGRRSREAQGEGPGSRRGVVVAPPQAVPEEVKIALVAPLQGHAVPFRALSRRRKDRT